MFFPQTWGKNMEGMCSLFEADVFVDVKDT